MQIYFLAILCLILVANIYAQTSATTCYGVICDYFKRDADCYVKAGAYLGCRLTEKYKLCMNDPNLSKCCTSTN